MKRKAGIAVIGNEILFGMVRDENSPFMAKQLRLHGIQLCRVSVIPDDIDQIAEVVKEFSKSYDYVFTTGGLGPTHDDLTMEGVSKAFGMESEVHPYLEGLLRQRFGDGLSVEKRKIAKIPLEAELIFDRALKFPLIKVRNVYVYPGVTKLLKKQFVITRRNLDGGPPFLARIFLQDYESEIAPVINGMIHGNKGVSIGTYTIIAKEKILILLTLESQDQRMMNDMLQRLLAGFPGEKVLRVDRLNQMRANLKGRHRRDESVLVK